MLFRVQKDKDNPYVMMNKSFFRDDKLSAKAKGILGYILTLPDDWRIYLDELITHFKDGKDSIRSGINELIESGYILRMRRRDENGRLREYVYDVFEVPSRIGKSNVGESNVGKSYVGKSNTTKYIYTQNNNKKINNKQINNHTQEKTSEENLCVEVNSHVVNTAHQPSAQYKQNQCTETLCVQINNVLGENISQKAVKELISQYGIDTVNQYLNNWDKYKPFAKRGQAAYFIYCIQHKIPAPTPSQVNTYNQNKIPQRDNFDQREYTDEEYESFYDNLKS